MFSVAMVEQFELIFQCPWWDKVNLSGHISVAMMAQFELILGLWDKVKINMTPFSGHGGTRLRSSSVPGGLQQCHHPAGAEVDLALAFVC